MSDDLIHITVDGKSLQARKGQMLIEVTDEAGIDIPRFCYHKKLSVAANCRMCLVEVEKAPKPLPACATPVMPDMVVHTKSEQARQAQRGTMEFLLINHPLDCPICDQGGECELQDVALGYGESSSQYTEGKRVVMDKYIGPLIATEMTRCIHCTRCVRFGEEIAGVRELGATGRGENVRIGTYIEKSVVSEVSGNVIDICPVGALTARPSRFTARAWELSQHPAVSPHDSVGSNIYVHTDKGQVNRVVPRENEDVNEVWISDRDRFSYQGLDAADRILNPMIKVNGELRETDWETALDQAAALLKSSSEGSAALISPYATVEELYLTQKLLRALGSDNIDHRLGQSDFSDQQSAPVMPWLNMEMSGLEQIESALLIGSNIRKEHPIAALRLRKAAIRGADVSLLNTVKAPLHFEALANIAAQPLELLSQLAGVALAAGASLDKISNLPEIEQSETQQAIAESLKGRENSVVLLGAQAVSSPYFAIIRAVAAALAEASSSKLAYLPEAGNTCGAWLSGCVPHRGPAGTALSNPGKNAAQILEGDNKTLLLLGVEPELDAADPAQAVSGMEKSEKVIAIAAYLSGATAARADIVLPQSVFTESAGTYVNASGRWQFSRGAAAAKGDSRPGWKILRVLGSLAELEGFDYESPEQVRGEVQKLCEKVGLDNRYAPVELSWPETDKSGLIRVGSHTLYSTDSIVRRASALQKTRDAEVFASVSPELASSLSLVEGDSVRIKQNGGNAVELPLNIDEAIPPECVSVPVGVNEASGLGVLNAPVELEKV